jgi:hypothetical protein
MLGIFLVVYLQCHICVYHFLFFFWHNLYYCYSAATVLKLTVVEICVRNTAHVDLLRLSYGEVLGDRSAVYISVTY